MNQLKAHVVTGRIVVDDRIRLHRALERSLVQADAGELIDADDVLAELAQPR